jgi:hypothetical protein
MGKNTHELSGLAGAYPLTRKSASWHVDKTGYSTTFFKNFRKKSGL